MACGKDGYVGTFIDSPSLTDFEFLVGWGKNRHFGAAETQVNRANMLSNSNGSGFGLVIIARVDYYHAWQHFHQTQVFQYLVGCTIFSQCEPCM